MPSLCSLPASFETLKSFHRQDKTSCHFIWLASLVPVSMHGGKSSSKQAASFSVFLYLCPLLCGIRDKLNSTLYPSLVSSLQGKCLSFRPVLKSEGQTKSVIDAFLEFFSSIQWYFKGCLCRQLLILLTWLLGTSFIFHVSHHSGISVTYSLPTTGKNYRLWNLFKSHPDRMHLFTTYKITLTFPCLLLHFSG